MLQKWTNSRKEAGPNTCTWKLQNYTRWLWYRRQDLKLNARITDISWHLCQGIMWYNIPCLLSLVHKPSTPPVFVCSMQKEREKAWRILSCDPRHGFLCVLYSYFHTFYQYIVNQLTHVVTYLTGAEGLDKHDVISVFSLKHGSTALRHACSPAQN